MVSNMDGKYQSYLTDCAAELGKIKQWIDSNKLHSNIQYLVSYAVIKSSGTIEYTMKQMLFDYLSAGCNTEALQFFTKHIIDASFNPSPGKIQKLLSSINPVWEAQFLDAIKGSQQKGDLKSLVDLRNNFAHGLPITASIENIINYFNSGVWILEKLNGIIFPPPD